MNEMNKNIIFELLDAVKDPEIPVLSIMEMGMLRDVVIENDRIDVIITPTYSGCPAIFQIKDDIESTLKSAGYSLVSVKTSLFPPWTTDWMSEESKEKLRLFGIAPPEKSTSDTFTFLPTVQRVPACPYCSSENTKLTSQFSSTACKSLHYCNSCLQPFEQFKCH